MRRGHIKILIAHTGRDANNIIGPQLLTTLDRPNRRPGRRVPGEIAPHVNKKRQGDDPLLWSISAGSATRAVADSRHLNSLTEAVEGQQPSHPPST
jgi:hypothetical protein